MKRLWAPWRIDYVEGEKTDEGCPFCNAVQDADDRAHLVVNRGGKSFVMLNKHPYIGGHLLVAPSRHIASMEQVDDDEKIDLFNMTSLSIDALKRAMKPDGFNVGLNIGKAAGAGVPGHLHIHIVPRWVGDTNLVPVLGEVRIINEHLDRSWEKLRKHWKENGD